MYEKDERKSEHLNSTVESGELFSRGPGEGKSDVWTTELTKRTTSRTQGCDSVSPKLCKIAELAREHPERVFTQLSHHIDTDFLHEAFRRTRKSGVVGVDGQKMQDYAANLDENLVSLLERFRSGKYKAPPVRRVNIPKGKGKTRPIGIPTVEDKVLQRAVTMVLSEVYEQDFLSCSYGFRPGRSAHDALDFLRESARNVNGGFVLDVDIKGFFDALDHKVLKKFLDQRVRDGVLRRVIHKWLSAGVFEDGAFRRSTSGTPQGGVVSPLLANLYLHHVLDKWFVDEIQPRLRGSSSLARYADDFCIVFSSEEDAQRVLSVLPKRLARFGLTMHPEKTRLLNFRRPKFGCGGNAFKFLGFTHYWGRTRFGKWMVFRKTSEGSMTRGLQKVREWCRRNRHKSIAIQHRQLMAVLRGHDNYFGVPGNRGRVWTFAYHVTRIWFKWLQRRAQRRRFNWRKYNLLQKRYPLRLSSRTVT